MDEIGKNFHNQNKPITKGIKRKGSNDDFGTEDTNQPEDDNEQERGPVENLMEPGKKISLDLTISSDSKLLAEHLSERFT